MRFSDFTDQPSTSRENKLRLLPDRVKTIGAGGLTALLGATCLATGAVASPAFPLLMLSPLLGLPFGSMQAVKAASSVALATALALPFATNMQAWSLGGSDFGLVLSGLAFGAFSAFVASKAAQRLEKINTVQKNRLKLLSAQSDCLITKHDRLGETLSVSTNAEAVTGTTFEDLSSSGFYERVHLQDRVSFLQSLQDAALSGDATDCQFRMRVKQGEKQTWRWMEMECFPEQDSNPDRHRVTAITKDISKLKMLEENLAESQRQLQEASESKQQFLGTVSHELRTPLNAIVGFSDILQEEIFGPLANDRQREHISHIQEAGNHLLSVVNTMLDLSRLEAGKYELSLNRFHLKPLVESCTNMLFPTFRKQGVELKIDIPDALREVRCDQNAIKQILINLLSNAAKFSPDGGEVKVSVAQTGTEFKLIVADEGIGISDSFKSRLGKPFEQAEQGHDRSFEGTGLGLSVVHGLVSLHNGNIAFDSAEGVGTTVTVTLPQQVRPAAPVPSDEAIKFIKKTDLRKKVSPATKPSKDIQPISTEKGERHARLSA